MNSSGPRTEPRVVVLFFLFVVVVLYLYERGCHFSEGGVIERFVFLPFQYSHLSSCGVNAEFVRLLSVESIENVIVKVCY